MSDRFKFGDKMPDGTIYAGLSPETGKPLYTTPADQSLMMTFNEAKEYAANLMAHGHRDWHMPTKNELMTLFNGRAVVGGFSQPDTKPSNKTGDGWYWADDERVIAGSMYYDFADWGRDWNPDKIKCSVRLVR